MIHVARAAVLSLLVGTLLGGCARFGFDDMPGSPAGRDGAAEGGAGAEAGVGDAAGSSDGAESDAALDGGALPSDGPPSPPADGSPDGSTPPVDGGLSSDATLDGWVGYQQILTFRSTRAPDWEMDIGFAKTGAILRWDLGDGTIVDYDWVVHTYTQSGEKIVRVYSRDGVAGITAAYLSSASIVGSFPLEISQFSELRTLIVEGENLSGGIPPQLAQLTKLEYLGLSGFILTGTIPVEITQLTTLQTLLLSGISLTGSIPPELGQLINLTVLDLGRNQFSGSIPAELGQLTKVERLLFASNQLSGAIPAELGNLSNLQIFRLESNQITGYERGAFSGLLSVGTIYLRDNLLDQASVDTIIDDLYQDRDRHPQGYKSLVIDGTNAAPSNQGLNQIRQLESNYGWSIACNGC